MPMTFEFVFFFLLLLFVKWLLFESHGIGCFGRVEYVYGPLSGKAVRETLMSTPALEFFFEFFVVCCLLPDVPERGRASMCIER